MTTHLASLQNTARALGLRIRPAKEVPGWHRDTGYLLIHIGSGAKLAHHPTLLLLHEEVSRHAAEAIEQAREHAVFWRNRWVEEHLGEYEGTEGCPTQAVARHRNRLPWEVKA